MMKVGLNPAISFKADDVATKKKKGRVELPEGYNIKPDTYDVKNKTKRKHSFKNAIGNIWKFFSVTGTMTSALIKGLLYGTMATIGVVGALWPFSALPKAFAKEGPTMKEILRYPTRYIGKKGKVFSAITGIGVLIYHIVKGKLDANQNTAVIDHKLKIKHREV